jgi:hypothetical protein
MAILTDPATAVTWIAASGGMTERDGEPVRSYGKDPRGYLVAVRTDTGTYPVDNLPAVQAAAQQAEADAWADGAEAAERAALVAYFSKMGQDQSTAEASADASLAAQEAYYASLAHDCPREDFLEDPITVAYGVSGMVSMVACATCEAMEV